MATSNNLSASKIWGFTLPLMALILISLLGACNQDSVDPAASSDATGVQTPTRTPAEEILVDSNWIAANSDNLTILDIAREEEDFLAGHIPGAILVPRTIVWDEVGGIPGMLPDPEAVAQDFSDLGVDSDTPVVVYDGGNGLWASRFFWALEYLGHTSVHLLDGGYAAYSASGLEVSTTPAAPARGVFEADVQEELLADKEYILESLENPSVVVVDTRSEGEYAGEDIRADRGGRIPGALHIEWTENLNEGFFKPSQELRDVYAQRISEADEAITLCQTGVRGSHSYLALRVLGYENVRLYDGSWADWGNDGETPIEL